MDRENENPHRLDYATPARPGWAPGADWNWLLRYGIVLVLFLGVVWFILVPSCNSTMPRSRDIAPGCRRNISTMYDALHRYAIDHEGRFPDTLEKVLIDGYLSSPRSLVCGGSNEAEAEGTTPAEWVASIEQGRSDGFQRNSYVYVGKGLTTKSPASTPLLFERATDNDPYEAGRNVLFIDGQIKFMSESASNALLPANLVAPATQKYRVIVED